MSYRPLILGLLAAPFLLSACGEGYEAVKTTDYFPYGNQRTAGSGVAYVVAKMMPTKELKLEPKMEMEPVAETKRIIEEIKEPPPAMPREETPMEEVFQEEQKK